MQNKKKKYNYHQTEFTIWFSSKKYRKFNPIEINVEKYLDVSMVIFCNCYGTLIGYSKLICYVKYLENNYEYISYSQRSVTKSQS